jgi:hypothetical protein
MPGFSVNIGADTAQLAQGLSKAQADVLQFTNAIVINSDTAASALGKIPAALRPINPAQMQSLRDAVQKMKQDISSLPKNVPDPFNNVQKGANQATVALTNVGRVAQDLPFGFIGIQNNLNPLLESFQRLKAETGSSSAAFKALGSSLLGAGGVGLALSVVTAGILIFQNGIAGFNSKTKEAKKEADEFSKLLQNVSEDVGKSASRVTTLFNALNSNSLNTSQRKRALEELKQQNQEFFGALTEEKGLINGLQAAYDGYLERIKAIATAKAIESQLTKLFDKKLELELNIDPKFNAAISPENQRLIGALQKQLDKLGGRVDVNAVQDLSKINDNLRKRLELQTRINNLKSANIVDLSGSKEQIEDLERRIKGLTELQKTTGNFDIGGDKTKSATDGLDKQLSLLEKIRDAQKDFTGKMFDLKSIDDATDKLAKLEQQVGNLKLQIAVRDAKKAGLPTAEIEKLKEAIKQDTEKRLNEAFEKEALLLEFSTKLKFSPVNRAEIPANIDSQVSKATGFDKHIPVLTIQEARIKILGFKKGNLINQTEEILKDLNKQINQTIKQGMGDAFASIGEAFGDALLSGDFGSGLKKAAQSILSILGGVLQQIGRQVITAALAIKALKATLEKWAIANPGLAIVAGIGLVALGAALKNTKFEGPKFATGGIVSGPIIGQIGEMHRPEVIMPLDRLPQMLRSIGGGGGNDLQFIPIINNEGLYLAVQRGARRVGRKF